MPVVFFLAVDKASDIRAAVSTDLELHNALRRRGVAYDVAGNVIWKARGVRKVTLTFETSRPTWVSVQDVVLNKLRDRPRNQVNRSQSSATFTTTHKRRVSSCRYGSCWRVTPWHKTDAESPVSIFLPTSQKRSKTHVVTKSLYIKTWFVCLNKFECLKTVETFQAPKHVLWCLPQIF